MDYKEFHFYNDHTFDLFIDLKLKVYVTDKHRYWSAREGNLQEIHSAIVDWMGAYF